MVARSATRNLRRQLIQQLRVSLRIDLASEQPGSAFDCEPTHLAGQALAGARGFTRNLVVSLSDQPLRLARCRALRFLDDLVRALAGLIDDLRRTVTRFADDLLG